jgi:hydrogenase-4 component B
MPLGVALVVSIALAVGATLTTPRRRDTVVRGAAWLMVASWTLAVLLGVLGFFWSGSIAFATPAGTVGWHLNPWVGGWLAGAGVMGGLALSVRVKDGAAVGEMVSGAWLGTAIVGFLSASDALAMVLAWGLLTASAYGAVVAGAHRARTLTAGWVLLVMNELGTAALIVAAILLTTHRVSGAGFDVVALLGLWGLGAKIGVFPFQVWLPVAEPEAPGVVAGVLSGVTTAVVLVGLAQWFQWTHPDMVAGWITVGLGLLGGVLGAIHAALDHDVKRVLAYSTVEWMGLAVTLLGLSIVFERAGDPVPAAVALAGCFAVAAMHLGAKTAAFVVAGWVERTAGRRLDAIGGLFRRAGWLGRFGLVAVVALMALPPTGGYVAEWLSLESVFMGGSTALRPALIGVGIVLALLTATGATAMLRWFGAIFLGPPRARKVPSQPRPDEMRVTAVGGALAAAAGVGVGWWLPWAARWAAGPVALGGLVAPTFAAHPAPALLVSLGGSVFWGLPGAIGAIVFPGPGFTATAPWYLLLFGGAMVGAVALIRARWIRRHGLLPRREQPWSGGTNYRREHAWTASAITHPLRLAFAPVVRLERRRHEGEVVHVRTESMDRLLEQGMRPLKQGIGWLAARAAETESGDLSHYVLYVLGALVLGLVVLKLHGA